MLNVEQITLVCRTKTAKKAIFSKLNHGVIE